MAEAISRNMTYGQLQVEETVQMLREEREKWRGLRAVMVKDDYSDLSADFPYIVEKLHFDGHIKLKNKPTLYDGKSFTILYNGNKVSFNEAYRQQQLWVVKQKLGIK